jgi:hypothetical protein
MRLHNRYLPDWVHRILNGLMATALLASVGILPASVLTPCSWLWWCCLLLAWTSPVVGILLAVFAPSRFSLVRGAAGGDGYDELE